MERILVLAHKFRSEDQNKKRSSARNLKPCFGIHSCFSSNKMLLTLGGHKRYFEGALAPKCTPVALGLLLSFGAQFSLGGHISRWGGTSNDFGGTVPKSPPPPRGAGSGLLAVHLLVQPLLNFMTKQKSLRNIFK